MKAKIKGILGLLVALIVLNACATFNLQYNIESTPPKTDEQNVIHTFYLSGGLGNNGDDDGSLPKLLKHHLDSADAHSTAIFLGDNISGDKANWSKDKALVNRHLKLIADFKGNTILIPGNNEWKSFNTKKIEKVEEYLKDLDQARVHFYPENTCPIEHKVINDQLDVILIDSKWFISNWSRVEGINNKCSDIVTRRRFREELEGYINDGQGKNIIIAMHHPIFSNGEYAGNNTFASHMVPLPGIGTLVNGIKEVGGFSPDRLSSRRYNHLRIVVSALAQSSDRITVVSGHEESLQYLSGGSMHQIISGSLGSTSATHLSKDRIKTIGGMLDYEGHYSYGKNGFVKLEYLADGSSRATFITGDIEPYTLNILPKLDYGEVRTNFTKPEDRERKAAIIEETEELRKSKFFEFLWGKRHRSYYGLPVTAPIVDLDTLYGGLKVAKEGGGHQSHSLRLEDRTGKEYAMRSLRKSALKFLKFKVPGVAYVAEDYEDTVPEEIVEDFFTTAHPYMQLVINPLAKAIDVNHSDTRLFYVPKQNALGRYNTDYGNELYYIERRPSDEQMNYKGYRRVVDESGKVTDVESTTDMLEKVKSDEEYTIDQRSFLRARIFDMLLGDWDRHQDQWRWIEYEKEDGDKEFMPVPRDRDNAFPQFDGTGLGLIKLFFPVAKRWQSFDGEIANLKWLNSGGYSLDKALLTKYDAETWEEEAKNIQKNLTEDIIDKAFLRLPMEVRDSTSATIKQNLKERLQNLHLYALEYGRFLDRSIALYATEKDDIIKVERLPDGNTKIVIRRILSDDPNEKFYERIFNKKETKEIWIYGLGDDDVFEVTGNGKDEIFIRLIGGYGRDTYTISNDKALKVYDWKYEKSDFKEKSPTKQLTDVYNTNTFHWRFFELNNNVIIPNIGFRNDDGLFLGATNIYTDNGFNGNPFRQKHSLSAKYYFAFQAAELAYQGIFANIFPKWNFELDSYYSSETYVNNFFGFGNETPNLEDSLDIEFYRARMEQMRISAGIAYHTFRIRALYESYDVTEMANRFFNRNNLDERVFDHQNYVGGETSLYYYNDDVKDFPTKAIYFGLTGGYKANLDITENRFGYLMFNTEISHKLIPSGNLVLGTKAEWRTNFGDNYFFYHAPSLGGNNGLRGFRDERFTGKSYFYQTTDLRLRLKRYVTSVVPITIGLYGGFDYGRVWQPNEDSNQWHTSQGGGFWIGGFNYLAFNLGFFNSVEGNMFQVGFGFGF
ncbi:hypothetical protein [Ulvibacterium sp.]|uniref:hypothetical protein n=1 Tax=Ulvibacterium sp. TaxID=2665914 RepID=UPI003BAC57A3